jgi:beta-glucosidase/6-phospho-beta-glucosidase/beta-galactosidase
MRQVSNGYFAPRVTDAVDWFGRAPVLLPLPREAGGVRNDFERRSDLGWDLCPDGHAPMLREIAGFGKPVYVTESGLAARHDRHRA